MLPRWYLLGYRPNSAQISNITSVWNKRKLNIKFKIPMKACFLRCCLHNMCAETHLVVHFQRPQLGFQLAGIHYHLCKDSVDFKTYHMIIKSFQSHTAVRIKWCVHPPLFSSSFLGFIFLIRSPDITWGSLFSRSWYLCKDQTSWQRDWNHPPFYLRLFFLVIMKQMLWLIKDMTGFYTNFFR